MKTSAELRNEATAMERRASDLHREAAKARDREEEAARRLAAKIPVDRSRQVLAGGEPVPDDDSHRELRPDGQQKGYVVLSADERAKGFVRPFRDAYRHVGTRPLFATRELTPEERERYGDTGYVAFEPYPEGHRGSSTGRFWTEAQLNSGCGAVTTMARSIAETYARDPHFYGGTFCTRCGTHFPVGENGEFTWYEMDGSDGPKVGT